MKIFAMRHYKDGCPALFSTKGKAEAAAERWKLQGLRDWQGDVEIDEIDVDAGEEDMHNHCHHVFEFCLQCDLVYCTSCKREWGGHRNHNYYPYQSVLPWTYKTGSTGTGPNDFTLTFSGDTSGPVTDTVTVHTHG